MNPADLMRWLPQALLSGCAAVLGFWLKLPWLAVVGLGLLTLEMVSISRRGRASAWSSVLALTCTLLLAGGLLIKGMSVISRTECVVLGLLNAVALLLTSYQLTDVATKNAWRILGIIWAFAAGLLSLGCGYSENVSGSFYLGLATSVSVLIMCQVLLRLRPLTVQIANTLVLLLIGLPITDWFVRPAYRTEVQLDPRKKYYLYENAKRDPGGFAAWQESYPRTVGRTMRRLCIVGSFADVPWPLKPGSHWKLYDCGISINSNGFRGREISEPKGNTYRIVALGESTTFGITLTPEDKPWAEWLEQVIRERLKPTRPVQVINAGVPGYGLRKNLDRLASEILPLKPDMIISYHGYNSFFSIQQALPFTYVKAPPAYRPRPLKLLADCEYHLKILCYDQRAAHLHFDPPAPSNLLETDYAKAYLELVRFAQTNSIRLVLANYSMAVNNQSDRRVIEFYRPWHPSVYWDIQANEVHSSIVKQVAESHPEVCFVDTHPGLDGEHDKFIDLVHFDAEGEQQMARTIFTGIKKVLVADLVQN